MIKQVKEYFKELLLVLTFIQLAVERTQLATEAMAEMRRAELRNTHPHYIR